MHRPITTQKRRFHLLTVTQSKPFPLQSEKAMKKLFAIYGSLTSLTKPNSHGKTDQFIRSVSTTSTVPTKPDSIYRRISPLGDPSVSMVPILDQWIKDGNFIAKPMLRGIINELNNHRRFKHALEVSQWMTDKRYISLNSSDVAMRMNLIFKVHGLEQVENYFSNIPQGLKSYSAHIALLNCYALSKSVDKAEDVMQKARDMGYVKTPMWYNIMANLYYNLGNFEKIELLVNEMEEKGIRPDKYTLTVRLKAYTDVSDSEGIDSVVNIMQSDPHITLDWNSYAVSATAYMKIGSTDKALEMLRKMELLVEKGKRRVIAVRILFQLYAKAGKKDELYRVWNEYKNKNQVYNNVYISMMNSLMKLEEFDCVESIYKEWESSGLSYDVRIVNYMIDAYCRTGNLEKAEDLLKQGIAGGGRPNVLTWCILAGGYVVENKSGEAIDSLKKAILLCQPDSNRTRFETLNSCLEYLEGENNIDKFRSSLITNRVPSKDVLDKLFYFIKTGEYPSHSGAQTEELVVEDELVNHQ